MNHDSNDPATCPPPPARLAWTVWGLAAVFYLIGFYQRVAPAVMTSELMSGFNISAAGLGNLSAFYFYSYVAMQAPTGILADRWGPRRLLALGALTAGIGTGVFAMAPSLAVAGIGRLLIGGSVAVAFVGLLKLAAHWFPPRQFAMASGVALFFGIIGAVFAGVPLRLMVDAVGWRPVMTVSAVFTLALSAMIWLIVRDDPEEKGFSSYGARPVQGASPIGILAGIRTIFQYRNTWLLCIIPGGIVGSVLTFSGLWGVPFLSAHYGFSQADAAALCSALLVSWALGGPVFGALSDRLGRRKPLYVAGCFSLACGWSGLIFIDNLPLPLLIFLLLFTGFASGCMIISFAFAKESVPAELAGTVSGICNMGVMTGPMVLQPAVGLVLDLNWTGDMAGAIKTYSLAAYRLGFSLMLAWAVLGAVLILFTKETRCEQLR